MLTGDVAMVAMDRRSLSFMYSFPNYIPLNAAAVRRIWAAVEPLAFDRIYGAWWGRNIADNAKAAFEMSVAAVYRERSPAEGAILTMIPSLWGFSLRLIVGSMIAKQETGEA